MFKGTKKPHLQIASNIFTMLKITELLQTKFIEPEVQNFIENLSIKKKVSANKHGFIQKQELLEQQTHSSKMLVLFRF